MAVISSINRHFAGRGQMIKALLAVNIGISMILWIISGVDFFAGTRAVETLEDFLTLPCSFDLLAERPWTLVTYMFTQLSPLHLFFNMLWLYWFGIYLKRFSGRGSILLLYLAGGICGGLLFLVSSASGGVYGMYLTGASASVMAFITAVASRLPSERVPLMFKGHIRMIWIAALAILLALLGGDGTTGGFPAHAGGAIAGLIYGLAPLPGKLNISKKLHELRIRLHAPKAQKVFESASIGGRTIEESRGRAANRERLDQLLDKIRISGYESLTTSERRELDLLSRNI